MALLFLMMICATFTSLYPSDSYKPAIEQAQAHLMKKIGKEYIDFKKLDPKINDLLIDIDGNLPVEIFKKKIQGSQYDQNILSYVKEYIAARNRMYLLWHYTAYETPIVCGVSLISGTICRLFNNCDSCSRCSYIDAPASVPLCNDVSMYTPCSVSLVSCTGNLAFFCAMKEMGKRLDQKKEYIDALDAAITIRGPQSWNLCNLLE